MKPLKLTIYPRGVDHHGEPAYMDPDVPGRLFIQEAYAADYAATVKRFTDAELAAEHWRAAYMTQTRFHAFHRNEPTGWMEWDKQCETLHRFASTPSYDE